VVTSGTVAPALTHQFLQQLFAFGFAENVLAHQRDDQFVQHKSLLGICSCLLRWFMLNEHPESFFRMFVMLM
jgi:hypothetical protein